MDAQERPFGTLVPESSVFFRRSKRKYLDQLVETKTIKLKHNNQEQISPE